MRELDDKYCVDCKHHSSYSSGVNGFMNGVGGGGGVIGQKFPTIHLINICSRNLTRNLVTKQYIGNPLNCEAEREDALRLEQFRCGKEGKFFDKF